MKTKSKEIYISVDVETSGPIPGEYSLLSIGACVVGDTSKSFYIELKPLNNNYVKRAFEVSNLSLKALKMYGEDPASAMAKFNKWITVVSKECKPIFVAFNATFDWMFVHWYFIKFLGKDPFGISGVDIKAYFMGKYKVTWSETSKKHVRKIYRPSTAHTHNALDDAKEQAEIFVGMLDE